MIHRLRQRKACRFCYRPQTVTFPYDREAWHCDHCDTLNLIEQ